jgi:hypothetical protein
VKILLDNCVPKRAKRLLLRHDVKHASEVGMSQLSNGNLLKSAAQMGFDVLLTVDQHIRYQHNLESLPLAVLELNTRDSRLPALEAMAAYFEAALSATTQHRFVSLDKNGRIVHDSEK